LELAVQPPASQNSQSSSTWSGRLPRKKTHQDKKTFFFGAIQWVRKSLPFKMHYERFAKRHQDQHVADAKAYIKAQVGGEKYKEKYKLFMEVSDHEEAWTNRHLAVLADQLKREELTQSPKDFIRNPTLLIYLRVVLKMN
jgi:hypothetical protein